jgi:two-component system response regulator NreC
MENAVSTRVLLVDDHPLVRDGLKTLIDSESDLLVVGEASSEEEAVRLVTEVAAEIALVDVSLPGRGGIKLTERILSIVPLMRVIAVTRHTDQAFVEKMLGTGAWGYVLKQSASSELLRAIRVVAAGNRFIDPALQQDGDSDPGQMRRHEFSAAGEPLSELQELVLRLVAQAQSNQEIADCLSLPLGDVVELKASGMRRAGLISRMDVLAYAQSRGWR